MTFSITGRCSRTGMLGVAISTSSIAVGSRCPHARAGVGAVATQNVTDPHLAALVLGRLEQGQDAQTALNEVMTDRPNRDYRQLAVIDANGNRAHFTGGNILGNNQVVVGDSAIAAGNLLSSTKVADAIASGFDKSPDAHLAERLLQALEAGEAAGGEEGPVRSAALYVVDQQPFSFVDLRVDWSDEGRPIETLRALWTDFEPQAQDYLNRAVNPALAPSYGVAGDP